MRRVGQIEPLWQRVVPAEWRQEAWLTCLESGCLHVAVRDAAYRFEFERVIGPQLLRAVQMTYPKWGVRQLRVTVCCDESGQDGRA